MIYSLYRPKQPPDTTGLSCSNIKMLQKKKAIPHFSTSGKRYKLDRHPLACNIDLKKEIAKKNYYQAKDHVTSARRSGMEKGAVKPLLGAVIGAVTGIAIGYYIPRVGVAAGGLAGTTIGFAVGVVATTLTP